MACRKNFEFNLLQNLPLSFTCNGQLLDIPVISLDMALKYGNNLIVHPKGILAHTDKRKKALIMDFYIGTTDTKWIYHGIVDSVENAKVSVDRRIAGSKCKFYAFFLQLLPAVLHRTSILHTTCFVMDLKDKSAVLFEPFAKGDCLNPDMDDVIRKLALD